MKLKHILGTAVFLGSMILMTMGVQAASSVKVGEIYDDNTGEGYTVVPLIIESTDVEKLYGYTVTLKFDSSKYTYDSCDDTLTYNSGRKDEDYGKLTVNLIDEGSAVKCAWYNSDSLNNILSSDPDTGLLSAKIVNVYFKKVDGAKPEDFSVVVDNIYNFIDKDTQLKIDPTKLCSFFSFEVTGKMDGNEYVGLATSIDGGETYNDLKAYVSHEQGADNASSKTKFLVGYRNTGNTAVRDVQVYGKKADNTYVHLPDYDQKGFVIQAYK